MADPIDTVTRFLHRWGPREADLHGAMREFLAPHAVWENIGLGTSRGPEEAISILQQFAKIAKFAAFEVEVLHIAAVGDVVLCERVDRPIRADGSRGAGGVRCTGVFEISEGRIVAWRDYFDTAPFARPSK